MSLTEAMAALYIIMTVAGTAFTWWFIRRFNREDDKG
jgi:DNA-binding transcriptional regulator of glucitol operon